MSNQIQIHEFSTGIQVRGNSNNWYSLGSTGQYMNKTLDPIPASVIKAIVNKEFSIYSSPPEPVIIGRQIITTLDSWSVIATITEGKDDQQRSIDCHRYFLCQGADGLAHILAWMLQQKQQTGQFPVFDPFNFKTVGQPHQYDTAGTRSFTVRKALQDLLTNEPPIIVPYNNICTPVIVNALATQKSQENGEPVSWAYGVKNLVKPFLFGLIYPYDEQAQITLEQQLFPTTVNDPPVPDPTIIINDPTPAPQDETTPTPIPEPRPGQIEKRSVKPSFDPQPMRIYLYALAGVTSALIGWNLSHFLLTDLQIMREFPQLIIFPLVTISLAVGMVINEIFISSPTRAKTNLKLATAASFKTIGIGALLGLAAAGLSFIFFLPRFDFPLWFVRTFGWLLIGVSVGLAEGLTWRDYSVESGNKKRKNQRLIVSLLGATFASVFAAVLFEISRSKFQAQFTAWQNWEDPLGFALLGLILGLSFSLTNSPSYQAALRAGTGFEYRGEHFYANGGNLSPPGIDLNILSFVSDPDNTTIEEGLSIALPGFGVISIGSDINADICIPNLAPHVADITIDRRKALLLPDRDHYKSIAINNRFLNTPVQRTLKHNTLITFHPLEPDEEQPKFYRFVYYNRFLDPQA